jgi:DNA-binding NarL/FixJ family response regulator
MRCLSSNYRDQAGAIHDRTGQRAQPLREEGLSNPEIAAKLLLSRRIVATHVSHILRKLGVNSRIDIAREAALRAAASR